MLIIEVAIGYMLKVIKSGRPISKYREEFSAIRHGNYYEFINRLQGQLPFIVTYKEGQVYVDTENNEDDIDFAGLLKAGPSLKTFYENCIDYYGEIIDEDISDSLFCKLAYFELSLRMHANNKKLISKKDKLFQVIDQIGKSVGLTKTEIEALHLGRQFLNMVKHKKDQFKTWQNGIDSFNAALSILKKYGLTII